MLNKSAHRELHVLVKHGPSLGQDEAGNVSFVLHKVKLEVILDLLPGDEVTNGSPTGGGFIQNQMGTFRHLETTAFKQ